MYVPFAVTDIDNAYLASQHPFVEGLKLLNKLGSFLGVCFGQVFLALLPTQIRLLQDGAQGTPTHWLAQFLCHPPAQLFHGPIVTRQSVLYWLTVLDRIDELLDFFWAKRGARPPVC